MKKHLSLLFAACLCICLCACGNTASEQPAQTEKATETTTTTAAETTTTTVTTTMTVTTTEAPETTTAEPETSAETPDESDSEDGMYPMEECIRRVIRDNLGQEVVSFEESNKYKCVKYVAILEDNQQVAVFSKNNSIMIYDPKLISIDNFYWNDMTDDPIYDGIYYQVNYVEKE